MKVGAKIYKSDKGTLRLLGEGDCEVYKPNIVKKSKYVNPHITIAIGDFRLHLDKGEFLRFCSTMLYNQNSNKEITTR